MSIFFFLYLSIILLPAKYHRSLTYILTFFRGVFRLTVIIYGWFGPEDFGRGRFRPFAVWKIRTNQINASGGDGGVNVYGACSTRFVKIVTSRDVIALGLGLPALRVCCFTTRIPRSFADQKSLRISLSIGGQFHGPSSSAFPLTRGPDILFIYSSGPVPREGHHTHKLRYNA